MELLTRKNGVLILILGIIIFFLNFFTYTLWRIDIDIFGAMIILLGIIIAITCGKSMKKSKGFFTRRTGVWICITSFFIILLTAFLPMNTDIFGITGSIVFLLGLILIIVRWNY